MNYVLNDNSDNALNPLLVSQSQQGGVDIYDEILPGDEEDNDVQDSNTDNILW
jgi:hypothetical protein